MAMIFKLAVILLSGFVHGSKYAISDNSVSESNATALCSLATPDVLFDQNGNTVDIKMDDIQGGDDFTETLWIGYAQIYVSLLYVGCSSKSALPANQTYGNMPADPGQCYSRCNTEFVGMEENKCYCMSHAPVDALLSDDCSRECSMPLNTLCGKKNQRVSIYQKVTYPAGSTGEDQTDKACRAVQPTQKRFEWEECSKKLYSLCQQGSYKQPGDYVYDDDDDDDSEKWKDVMKDCLDDGHYPANERPGNIPDGTRSRWTGIIRSLTIVKAMGTHGSKPGFRQGYIYRDRRKYILKFDEVTGDHQGLCEITGVPTTTSQKMTGSTAYGSNSSNAITTANLDARTDLHIHSEDKDNPDLLPLYVVIPILIIAAVGTIVFLLWRKRQRASSKTPNMLGDRGGGQTNIHDGVTNSAYDKTLERKPSIKNDLPHDYLLLEPASEYAMIKESEMDRTKEENYDTTQDAHAMKEGAANESGNVYNRLENVEGDPYNHSNEVNHRIDDTYNHMEGDASYNTTVTEVGKTKASLEGDYSHADQTYNQDV